MTRGDCMVLRYEFRILYKLVTELRLAKFAIHFEIPKPYDTIWIIQDKKYIIEILQDLNNTTLSVR